MMDKYVVFILSCAVLCSAAVTELNYKVRTRIVRLPVLSSIRKDKSLSILFTLMWMLVDMIPQPEREQGNLYCFGVVTHTSGSYATMDSVVVTQVVDMV
jgi:hypothetical protein